MSIFFNIHEIFQFAVRVEENGERFYRHAAKIAEDGKLKQIFNDLADKEIEHKKFFEDLLLRTGESEPLESYQGEYLGYLRSYVDKIIFADEPVKGKISEITNVSSALDFGIQRELDSVLYYHEIKNFMPESQRKLVDKIIDEERKHFSQLSELRKKMR